MRYTLVTIICILLLPFTILGCGSVNIPATYTFPSVPDELTQDCPELNTVTEPTTLSSVTNSVVKNYTLYHECQTKVSSWNDWYSQQKQIFDAIGKK